MHAPFGGLCLARPHSLSLSFSPDYALLELLFERATPAYALLERLFERALARASACASLHLEGLPAAGAA